jgi:hypothetical protein
MLGEGRIETPLSTLGEPMPKEKTMDLFGFEQPKTPSLTDEGFEEFWLAYPKCVRKGEKSACKKKWVDSYYFSQKHIILNHVKWMATTAQWLKDNGSWIPAPKVYLNQQRWDGADIPESFGIKVQIDPALAKIEADNKKAVPMPEHIRQAMAQLRSKS